MDAGSNSIAIPRIVRAALRLYYVTLLVGVAEIAVAFPSDSQLHTVGAAIALLLSFMGRIFIFKMISRGHNWARFAVIAFLLGQFPSPIYLQNYPFSLDVLIWTEVTLNGVALILLFQGESFTWFKAKSVTGTTSLPLHSGIDGGIGPMDTPLKVQNALKLLYITMFLDMIRMAAAWPYDTTIHNIGGEIFLVLAFGFWTFLLNKISHRKNWARITFLVLLLGGFPGVHLELHTIAIESLGRAEGVLTIAALVFLFESESTIWFKGRLPIYANVAA